MGKRKYNFDVGRKFGRWTIIGMPFGRYSYKKVKCLCDCGRIKDVWLGHLRSGRSLSCGCLHYEAFSEYLSTHKGSKTRLFHIWMSMRGRCNNPKNSVYHIYGGRGITVCCEWNESFVTFRDWANINGYRENLEIDRIDNNKGYSPHNCRWATDKKQCRNKRCNLKVSAFEEIKVLAEWADDPRCQVAYKTLWRRLKDGWPIEEAITRVKLQHGFRR